MYLLQFTGPSSSVSEEKLQYYKSFHELESKQRQRINLLKKIRHQKELLVKRGDELLKQKVQLQRIRKKNKQRHNMTPAECLQILKGNMQDHALELLYTQLMAAENQKTRGAHSGSSASLSSMSASTSVNAVNNISDAPDGANASWTCEEAEKTAAEEVAYTPKVLEAALLFSVAGKKAYKAMNQTLKFPSYTEIVKWKKIIRSNPSYYRRHFPNLKARFFKNRHPEEKGKHKTDSDEKSFKGDFEMDGFQSERENNYHEDHRKKHESIYIDQEEADRMYQKLLNTESHFQKIISSEDTPRDLSALSAIVPLPQLFSDNEMIDYNVSAAKFITAIRNREKEIFYRENTIDQHEEDMDEHDPDYPSIKLFSADDRDLENRGKHYSSIDDTIQKVIGDISYDVEEKASATLSITATSDGSPRVENSDEVLTLYAVEPIGPDAITVDSCLNDLQGGQSSNNSVNTSINITSFSSLPKHSSMEKEDIFVSYAPKTITFGASLGSDIAVSNKLRAEASDVDSHESLPELHINVSSDGKISTSSKSSVLPSMPKIL